MKKLLFSSLILVALCHSSALSAEQGTASTSFPSQWGSPLREDHRGPFQLRGYGEVTVRGGMWKQDKGTVSLVVFETESEAKATLLASKYLTDLKAYSDSKVLPGDDKIGGSHLEIVDAGLWVIGRQGSEVFVLSGPDRKSLLPFATQLQAERWQATKMASYPKYLDCFDNASLGFWWMPPTKPQEIMDFVSKSPVIVNVHAARLSDSYAPDVFDYTANDNVIAQARLLGRPYRQMIWGGLPSWWSRDIRPVDHFDLPERSAFPWRDMHSADEIRSTQITSPIAKAVELNSMLKLMEQYRDDENLVAWMEPHGEFSLEDPRTVPPGAAKRFPEYLQTVKGYSLEQANKAFGTQAASWEKFPYPEMAYFFGRRGEVVDLDDAQWRWRPRVSLEEGLEKGFNKADFDDSTWGLDLRQSRRLHNQIRFDGRKAPLWYRFQAPIPADFLKGKEPIYLHVLAFTEVTDKGGKDLTLWLNGQEVTTRMPARESHLNKHFQYDVSELLKPGKNEFVFFSQGGRFLYRTFVSKTKGDQFPFAEKQLNQFWLDWNDYLIWEKLETLKTYLAYMRSADPVRPIKVMTPHMFQSEAMDLFQKYGAYPQLTGEGTWYRPMHYKGYARLRGLPGSSEGGSAAPDARHLRQKFSNIFWENQDAHDYVFDVQRDFWPRKDVVEWWGKNSALLATLGKIDFAAPSVGLLRDVEQPEKYLNGAIWRWDLSRGPLPTAGLSPVLIDGGDFDRGLAADVPVIFDCSTSVMTPERAEAIKRYVEAGGIFVAQFNTGRHTPLEPDSWPLAKVFNLKVEDQLSMSSEDPGKWDMAKLRFTEDQNVMPSLRGRTLQGSGISIEHRGGSESGGIKISGTDAEAGAVALWEDGSLAICDLAVGKGRFIWVGTPFFVRFKDQEGKWINEESRQAMLEEMLTSLGVYADARTSDPRVWIERRESKNGLFDVYIASAKNIQNKDWDPEEKISVDLTLRRAHRDHVLDLTLDPPLRLTGVREGENLLLRDQIFTPYQVRQFAVIRKDVGLQGPLHWLDVQKDFWYAVEVPAPGSLPDVAAVVAEQARELGQSGLNISRDWKVQRLAEPAAIEEAWVTTPAKDLNWENGNWGTWLSQGWSDTRQARYRKKVTIPSEWREQGKRVLLGFSGFWSFGIKDDGKFWINGKPFGPLKNPTLVDVTKLVQDGSLDLALEVTGEPATGGPAGTIYLRAVDKPLEELSLNGEWVKAKSWSELDGTLSLPAKVEGPFGLRKTFTLPKGWEGKRVHLVIDQDRLKGNQGEIGGILVNQTGYMRDSAEVFFPYGVRIDQWLKPGQNEIELLVAGHSSYREGEKRIIAADIRDVKIEIYE